MPGEWLLVHDAFFAKHFEPEIIPKLAAYVEAKTAYEMLDKFLWLLTEGKAKGLDLDQLIEIVRKWLTDVEEHYRYHAFTTDVLFKDIFSKIVKLPLEGYKAPQAKQQ